MRSFTQASYVWNRYRQRRARRCDRNVASNFFSSCPRRCVIIEALDQVSYEVILALSTLTALPKIGPVSGHICRLFLRSLEKFMNFFSSPFRPIFVLVRWTVFLFFLFMFILSILSSLLTNFLHVFLSIFERKNIFDREHWYCGDRRFRFGWISFLLLRVFAVERVNLLCPFLLALIDLLWCRISKFT